MGEKPVTKRMRMNPGFYLIALLLAAAVSVPQAPAANTTDLILKTVQAAESLAGGNPGGAVAQVVPGASYQIPGSGTALYASPAGQAGVSQPIPGASALSNPAFNVNSYYNAAVNVSPYGPPAVNQGVNVTGYNRYLSNTTSFNPGFPSFRKNQ